MVTEIDSYLLKCALEALEEGYKAEEIEVECACRLGLITNVEQQTQLENV